MEQRNFPRRLKAGDVVGIAAPASPFDRAAFDQGLARLAAMGLKVRLAEEIYAQSGYLAGPDRQRAEQINRFSKDPEVAAVICARGGYGSMRILPWIDFAAAKENPKIFLGFSDATALLSALWQRSRLICFHGPTVTTLGTANPATLGRVRAYLMKTGAAGLRPRSVAVIQPGRAEGFLVGGNLTTLCHLTGTPFAPDFKDCILLLEDTGEAPYRIDRMLSQMRLAGAFAGLRGLALGTFKGCGPPQGNFSHRAGRFAGYGHAHCGGL